MKILVRSLLLAACVLVAAAPPAHAGASRLSYQGVLTDAGGNLVPDGNYNLTFRIYSVAAGGAALWTETHNNVPVVKGGFAVVLGNSIPIGVSFEHYATFYLGVQVGANPELAPRVQLAAAPSAMSLGMTGDTGALAGEMSWYGSTSGAGAAGGYLHLYGLAIPGTMLNLEPDFSGEGLWAWFGGAGGSSLLWNGDNDNGAGTLAISGTSDTYFHTNETGNTCVELPANAVGSGEMFDEPGISSNHTAGSANINSISDLALTDLISTTITTPAAGYVVVQADAQVLTWPGQIVGVQIGNAPGAALDGAHYQFVGYSGTTNYGYWPTSIHRVYSKAAGSHTFYFQGYRNVAGGGGTPYAWNPKITAHFFPTAYGSVTQVVSAAEAAGFESATPVTPATGIGQTAGSAVQVDLRELELRVRREEARLAEARKQLHDARVRQQNEASARAAALKKER